MIKEKGKDIQSLESHKLWWNKHPNFPINYYLKKKPKSLSNDGFGGVWELKNPPPSRPFRTVVTWLILPVVICLSQRLSHACLSISIIQRNCEWLIKTVIVYSIIKSTWITVVILELIHAVKPNFAGRLYLLDISQYLRVLWWFIITERIWVVPG